MCYTFETVQNKEKPMIYREFQGKQLSLLGFGAMRLPTLPDGSIDEAQVERMTAHALSQGVNYFDTAYPYHGGQSELVMGRVLGKYPRDSYYLATKFPGHQISSSYDPKAIFEEQLCKCGVEYFDFYLLHNVYENSLGVYLDPQWGILDYFVEQKRLGRIKHLGFSSHGGVPMLEEFLSVAGQHMEFCQIQLNYLDWTLQNAKEKVELLNRHNIPIWVMEPVRGGALCQLSGENEERLHALRTEEGIPSWGFRFLQDIPGVTVILSGMSNEEQMRQNIQTFSAPKPLSEAETQTLLDIAEGMKDSVPCTGCGYCMAGCPMELNIPMMISIYNDLRVSPVLNAAMRLDALEHNSSACVACGQCAQVCPQKIDIPTVLADLTQRVEKMPKWADISKAREEEAKRLRNK